jgi:hypothetical protein
MVQTIDLGDFALSIEDNYFYVNSHAGIFRVVTGTGYTALYTNLTTSLSTSVSLTNNTVLDIARVIVANQFDGNIVEIFDGTPTLLATYNFYPKEECKYTPVTIDFVNQFGAWQPSSFLKQVTIRSALKTRNTIYCKLIVLTTTYKKDKEKYLTQTVKKVLK